MSLMKLSTRTLGRQLTRQARSYRYRGTHDLDVSTPWYWMPMEAPNASQLPERWECYMFTGYGQEHLRYQYNPGGSNENERMGRRFMTYLGCASPFFLLLGGFWYWGRLVEFVREDDDKMTVRVMDFPKKPFDNMFLAIPGARPSDPEYQRHINSRNTH